MRQTILILTILMGLFVPGQQIRMRSQRNVEANNDPAAVNLVRTCESTVAEYYSMCRGAMAGLMLGIDASESLKDNRSICFPQGIVQTEDLIKVFSKYVDVNSNKIGDHVGHVAYRAFQEAYPCKQQ